MNHGLLKEAEHILEEVSKVISDPSILADARELLENLIQQNYIGVISSIIKLAEDVIEAS